LQAISSSQVRRDNKRERRRTRGNLGELKGETHIGGVFIGVMIGQVAGRGKGRSGEF
jgi:hypothetical protein